MRGGEPDCGLPCPFVGVGDLVSKAHYRYCDAFRETSRHERSRHKRESVAPRRVTEQGGEHAARIEVKSIAMKRILFICTANICRSPMAGGIFDALAEDMRLECRSESAGVAALVGEPAAPHAVRAVDEMGIDIRGHRARQVDEDMVRDADLVLAMTPTHRETLIRNFASFRERIHTLPEYVAGDKGAGIADPYGQSPGAYRASAREMLRYLELAVERLERERT